TPATIRGWRFGPSPARTIMHSTIADFPARLQAFLQQQVGAPPSLHALRHLTGGASRDTWSVDVEFADGPAKGTLSLVIRRDMGGEIDDQALDRDTEFRVLQHAHAGGVLVPAPRWSCNDQSVLGAAFFVMDRLEGESVGRRIVREPALTAARQALPRQMGE